MHPPDLKLGQILRFYICEPFLDNPVTDFILNRSHRFYVLTPHVVGICAGFFRVEHHVLYFLTPEVLNNAAPDTHEIQMRVDYSLYGHYFSAELVDGELRSLPVQ